MDDIEIVVKLRVKAGDLGEVANVLNKHPKIKEYVVEDMKSVE